MTYYQQLRSESRDLGEYIAVEMEQRGLLSADAARRLSSLNMDIAEIICDFISECQTENAQSKHEQY